MEFGQIFKKRGGHNGNIGEFTFETSEEKTEIPEIEGAMSQINRRLNETKSVVVQEKTIVRERGGCGC